MNNNTSLNIGKASYECFVCGTHFRRKKSQIDRLKDKRLTCSRACAYEKKSLMNIEKIENKLGIEDFSSWLEEKYHGEKMNARELAVLVYGKKTHSPNIIGWMKRFGIESRDRSEAVSMQWENNADRREEQARYVKKNMGLGTPARNRLIEVMQTDEYRKKTSLAKIGELNPNWNPELTERDRQDRNKCPLNARWVRAVKRRDNETCQCCGLSGVNIVAHHLNGFHWDKKNRYNVDNGVTLCASCHNDFHLKYGRRNNTTEQFEEYLKNTKKHTKQLALL